MKTMKTLAYQNTSDNLLVLVGVGVIEPGKTIESTSRLRNSHLKLVEPEAKSKAKQDDK